MKTDPLFELLHVLSKQEKRYVRLHLARPGAAGENYLRLYDACLKGSDLRGIRSQFKGEPLYRSFAVTKHYLYGQVLQALQLYRSSSEDEQLSSGLSALEVLYAKKLFGQGLRLVTRLRRLPLLSQRPQRALELLGWELRLLHAAQQVERLEKLNSAYYKEQLRLLEEQSLILELQKLSYDNFIALKKNWIGPRNEKLLRELKNFPLRRLSSLQAKIMYHQVLSARQFAVNDSAGAFKTLQQLSILLESDEKIRRSYAVQYVALLNNLNLLLLERRDFEGMLRNAQKLRAVDFASKEQKLRVQERVLNVESNVYRLRCELPAARQATIESLRLLDTQPVSPVYKLLFLLDAAIVHVMSGEFRIALRHLNRLLNETDGQVRPDIIRAARLLRLLVHYELGHEDLIDKEAAYKTPGKPDVFTRTLLTFFVKLPDAVSKRRAFRQLSKDLSRLAKKDEWRETYTDKFDFPAWAAAKANGRPLLEVLKNAPTRS